MDFVALADDQLLQCARRGHVEALGLLLFRSQAPLRAFLATQIGASLRASISPDDALQETYRHVFSSFDSFEGDELKSFSAWVRQIGLNQVRQLARAATAKKRGGDFHRVETADAFRSSATGLLNEVSTGDATVSQFVAREEAVDALRVALASLPSDQQQAIRLRYFEQMSVLKVADEMQRSEGSIRGLIKRAKEALRVCMHNSALWLSGRE